jgi:hypothetical protein
MPKLTPKPNSNDGEKKKKKQITARNQTILPIADFE